MKKRVFVFLALAATFGCRSAVRPRLGIVLVVDQMRADYLTRFDEQYTGGLRRMLDEGVVFEDAHQDHAATETAVGHSTISTGVFPSRHGIVGNDFFNRAIGRTMYSAEDTTSPLVGMPPDTALVQYPGRSPRNLQMPALGDWLQEAAPETRVFTVAVKDRSAILMGGHHSHGSFWYHGDAGHFVSSEYYGESLPDWVEAFNATRPFDVYRDTVWDKSADESAYALSRSDEFPTEGNGRTTAMPHDYPDNGRFYSNILYSPYADEVTMAFAREMIERENLGADGTPDLLMIGISTADYVGHMFGPHSHEVQDYYLRLDRMLGEFFEYLDDRLGRAGYVVALSADHGVLTMPEQLAEEGVDAGRVTAREGGAALQEAIALARAEVPIDVEIGFSGGIFLRYDTSVVTEDQIFQFREVLARKLRDLDFIADAYPIQQLSDEHAEAPYLDLYQRNYFPDRGPDVELRGKMNYLILSSARGTSHGSPYRYDTHVPIVFMGSGARAATVSRKIRTVDIAPTLSALLGVTPPAGLDGEVLSEVIR